MKCRIGCAACCVVISIKGPLPNMPEGKLAGIECYNLEKKTMSCRIWGTVDYPELCRNFKANLEYCGNDNLYAWEKLAKLELMSTPDNA